MATPAANPRDMYLDALENYLISMTRSVEMSTGKVFTLLLETDRQRSSGSASEIFMLEPRINEMEMLIDEHAVKLLRNNALPEPEIRQIVATLKITNDLERMGDLAVGLAERVISIAEMHTAYAPPELEPMVKAVAAMVTKSLGALTFRNVTLASQVLESDDIVDRYRDSIFENLMAKSTEEPSLAAPNLQFVLVSRYLERLADHATNIAEDIIFWVRGLDVRHGRGRQAATVAENS